MEFSKLGYWNKIKFHCCFDCLISWSFRIVSEVIKNYEYERAA